MPETTLTAEVGRQTGSRASRRLRTGGRIPGVVYGHGMEPLSVSVVGRELRVALSGEGGLNSLLSIEADGESYLALARELQRDPVKGTVTHVDFQIVRRDEVIAAEIPVTLIGEAVEVAHGDGLVEQQLFNLAVRALPADIPNGIEADISELIIGAAVRVGDLTLAEGVTTDMDPDTTVAVGQPPRVQLVEGEEEAAEGEAEAAAAAGDGAAEGAAAEGAEG